MPNLKQSTLSSLKGVVVIEEFERYKNILDNSDEPDSSVLNALKHLRNKKPSKEIISSTGIGSVLTALENHSNKDIVNEAKNLCRYWELNSLKKHQPTVEVRYDNLTLHIRQTSKRFFLKELGGEEEDENLADIIEKEIFHKCKRLISKSYRRTARKIIFVLKYEKSVKDALKQGKIAPTDFVKRFLKSA